MDLTSPKSSTSFGANGFNSTVRISSPAASVTDSTSATFGLNTTVVAQLDLPREAEREFSTSPSGVRFRVGASPFDTGVTGPFSWPVKPKMKVRGYANTEERKHTLNKKLHGFTSVPVLWFDFLIRKFQDNRRIVESPT